ncbi:rhomboid family intramembrane serine protease [Wenyingzhuangia sp. IMCC45533]
MKAIFSQIKYKYQSGSIVEKLIAMNIVFFILTYFVGGLGHLFNQSGNIFYQYLALPASFSMFLLKPWTIVSYGFLHSGFIHLLFNLITLYYIGNLFLDYFIPKKLLTFYLLGTIFGGVLFMLGYSYFPALRNSNSTLVGASAGVTAILVGLATYAPKYEIKFRFIGYIKLSYIAIGFVVWDLISLGTTNTGGHLAHLGGALYGFLVVYYDGYFKLPSFKQKNIFKKKNPLKTSYKSTHRKNTQNSSTDNQEKVDKILDKISKSGYESLSKEEKAFLFKQGKK